MHQGRVEKTVHADLVPRRHDGAADMRDFLSGKALGRTPPVDPDLLPLWDGISIFDTADRAQRRAKSVPSLGDYIAALDIPDDGSIRYERTLKRPGH